ncbi:hypothetical protein [Streptomyces sp. NPDC005876]|jgi:adenine/guanine phosphoribosyltransferase-like PRPP-binding protein|uniref:hypothetical protein n=1 Tax=unclassified Streptomyces TaxID=2593676 RepID=UPI0033F736A6
MIKQVTHLVPGTDPAGFALALAVASALHAPAVRAPEVAPRPVRAHRAPAVRRPSRA